MDKNRILKITLVVFVIIIILLTVILVINKRKDKQISNNNDIVDISDIKGLPKEIPVEDAVKQDNFVITIDKVYNKDVLDRFIRNTAGDINNRIEDKIKIVVYNYDGYPTIYDLEYKNGGYILITDASRNNIMPRDIVVNDDIPGKFYGITITEDPGVSAVSISLSLYGMIDYTNPNDNRYENIEIARYEIDAEIINNEENTEKR